MSCKLLEDLYSKGYQSHNTYKGYIHQSGRYDFVNVMIDGENCVFIYGSKEPDLEYPLYLTVSEPVKWCNVTEEQNKMVEEE